MDRTKQIQEMELAARKSDMEYRIKAAKQESRVQMINFITTYITERARLEMLALFGLIKLDR